MTKHKAIYLTSIKGVGCCVVSSCVFLVYSLVCFKFDCPTGAVISWDDCPQSDLFCVEANGYLSDRGSASII